MACFHAQQCAEKYLKALLVRAGQPYPRTHDLRALLQLCEAAGTTLPVDRERLDELSGHAVSARYPGEGPSVSDAGEALKTVRQLRRAARSLLVRPAGGTRTLDTGRAN
jgi:HEPN domain-containing protein